MKQQKSYAFYKLNTVGLFKAMLILSSSFLLLSSCTQKKKPLTFSSTDISEVITKMTDIMVRDITNPPLGARFFSYACLAGYEIVSENDTKFKSMYQRLKDYPKIDKPGSAQSANYQLAALLAIMETAKKMQPSGKLMDDFEKKFIDSCKKSGLDEDVLDSSTSYAETISQQILAYAGTDGYNKISNLPRYTPLKTSGSWYPTPPGFLTPVEPYFNTVRPFTLDSATQFRPQLPVAYDEKANSPFYKLTSAVYKEGNELKGDHREIASFWDCNPFAMQDEGHLMFGFKKISPGAHWMGITGIACQQAKKSFDEAMFIYSAVSIGLMEANISCWDEKYRSDRIRPETAIRKLIDPQWVPLLQTPPFPEYTSGHSVVSASSAVLLTHFFGDNFSYRDSVEEAYNIPPRSFKSFHQAAAEAAISRFYGGIHYMDAITEGQDEGTKVGEWILQKIK